MRKTLAASLLSVLFFVLVVVGFFLLDRPSGRDVLLGPAARPAADVPRARAEALAAVIVDDLGNNLEVARALCALGRPVTAAILPYTSLTGETVALARGAGLEIMLHLPLEALVPKENSTGRISSGMSADEARARVNACLDQIPGCRGVNNHEGSRTTEDAVLMPVILAALKDRGLYFIDSLTTRDSIAFETARRMGVPAAVRKVFLDAEPGEAAIRRRLVELFRAARTHGKAVGIGHARLETIGALGRYLGLAADYGVRLVPASAIVE
jgi:polysaccharide deacetylase 2 family uncharacterized protein YibQ